MEKILTFFLLFGVASASIFAILPTISHYHSQDSLGQYSFGYSGGPSAKHEIRTLDGITQGSYAYVDANNILQTVSYVSDPINGFRVAATNLPQQQQILPLAQYIVPIAEPQPSVEERSNTKAEEPENIPNEVKVETDAVSLPVAPEDTDEVKAAREAHLKAHEEESQRAISRNRRSTILAPLPYVYTPIVSHQYGIQNDIGEYSYGYSDNLSAKTEHRSIDGVTTGSYSYLDPNGQIQRVSYIADALGFRVVASNLPQGQEAVVAPVLALPVAPEDTPEVKAARKAHLEIHEKAAKENE